MAFAKTAVDVTAMTLNLILLLCVLQLTVPSKLSAAALVDNAKACQLGLPVPAQVSAVGTSMHFCSS